MYFMKKNTYLYFLQCMIHMNCRCKIEGVRVNKTKNKKYDKAMNMFYQINNIHNVYTLKKIIPNATIVEFVYNDNLYIIDIVKNEITIDNKTNKIILGDISLR